MDSQCEPVLERRAIYHAVIRPGRRKTREVVERSLLFCLAVVVALVGAKGIGIGLGALFAGVAVNL
jgi:hypothetical protein